MSNIENLVYNKKIYYKKKNNIVKYTKFCKEVNCKKYAYYNFKNEKKNYIVENIKKIIW